MKIKTYFLFLALLLGLIFVSGCVPDDSSTLPFNWEVETVSLGLDPAYTVLDVLSGQDPGGLSHIIIPVYSPAPSLGSVRKVKVLAIASSANGAGWTQPNEIPSCGPGPYGLGRANNSLHFLAGSKLRHWRWSNDSQTWEPHGQLISADGPGLLSFAVQGVHNALHIASLSYPVSSGNPSPASSGLDLRYMSILGGIDQSQEVPVSLPITSQRSSAVSLSLWRGGLHCFVVGTITDSAAAQYGRGGVIFYCHRPLESGAWSTPVAIASGMIGSHLDLDWLSEVGAVPGEDFLAVVFRGAELGFLYCHTTKKWSQVFRASGHSALGPNSTQAKSFVAQADSNGIRIAWIDDRFQNSDRSLFNPLGGFPWGDDPDWANNNLLENSFHIAGPLRVDLRSNKAVGISRDNGFVRAVCRMDLNGRPMLAWIGREHVEKSISGSGSSPQLHVADFGDPKK